jgi:hypothetical protein
VPLSYGTHVITATATDSGGLVIEDTATITLVSYPPEVSILNPSDGAMFVEGQLIQFRAHSTDLNSPTFELDDDQMAWTRAPVGDPGNTTPMGTGHLLTTSLIEGDWIITVTGTDDEAQSDSASITVSVGPPPLDLPPTAHIISTNYVCFPPDPVGYTLIGEGTDAEDGDLTGASLVWTKIVNGVETFVGTGEQVYMPFTGTTSGQNFTIRLTVTDSAAQTGTDSVVTTWFCVA